MKWRDENSMSTDAQFSFNPGYGKHDAIFALHSILSKSLRTGKSRGKRLYMFIVVLKIMLKSSTV